MSTNITTNIDLSEWEDIYMSACQEIGRKVIEGFTSGRVDDERATIAWELNLKAWK